MEHRSLLHGERCHRLLVGSDAGVLTRIRWFSFWKVPVPAVAHVWINQNQLESEFLLTTGCDTCLLMSLPKFTVYLLARMEPPSWSEATLILLFLGMGLPRGHVWVKQVLCRGVGGEAVLSCGC